MANKPRVATGYSSAAVQLVQATTLYLATKLGDLRDEVVIVGGLVPTLLIPQTQRPNGRRPHIGTMDVDLGLAIGILDLQRYHELCERLRNAGFEPDTTSSGRTTSQRWRIKSDTGHASVDFLIPATSASDKGGTLRNLEKDFAAIITPGLELAFQDRRLVTLLGETIRHEEATRELWVCEAGAFVVLKALAFQGRGENKDAYDLTYVLQNYGRSTADIFDHLAPLLPSAPARQALQILHRDFSTIDSIGVVRSAEFLGDPQDEAIRADAAGSVRTLLRLCDEAERQ